MGNDIKDLKIKAEQGDVVAQLNLGILYLEGDGVFKIILSISLVFEGSRTRGCRGSESYWMGI